MKKIALILFIILIFIPGCAYSIRYDGTYSGQIVDADTGELIEGVVVLGVWYKEIPTVAGPKHDYYDARETITDESGEFKIPGKGLRILSNLQPIRVTIFKAGYSYLDVPWVTLKKGIVISKKIKWKDDMAIIPLKKLSMEERKKQGSPSFSSKIPGMKIQLILKEINKDRIERGLEPIEIGSR